MKFPYRVKDKDSQKNFDFLTANLGPHGFAATTLANLNTSGTAGVYVTVAYKKVTDPGNLFDDTASSYRAPVTAWYMFTVATRILSAGAAGTRWQNVLAVNGTNTRRIKIDWATASWSNDYVLNGGVVIYLKKGDLVTVVVEQSSGAVQQVGSADAINNYFSGGHWPV